MACCGSSSASRRPRKSGGYGGAAPEARSRIRVTVYSEEAARREIEAHPGMHFIRVNRGPTTISLTFTAKNR